MRSSRAWWAIPRCRSPWAGQQVDWTHEHGTDGRSRIWSNKPSSRFGTWCAKLRRLSKSDVAPQQYYDALLNRVVSALAAAGGAIWTLGQGPARPPVPDQSAANRPGRQPPGSAAPWPPVAARAAVGRGDAGRAPLRRRRRRRGGQSDALSAPAGSAEKRPGSAGGRSRSFSGPTPRCRSSRAICGSSCRCASWPATISTPAGCGTSPTGKRSGRNSNNSPAWSIAVSIPA